MKGSIQKSVARQNAGADAKVRFCFFSVVRQPPLAGGLFSDRLHASLWMINYPAEGLFAGVQDG
jgi:hypothetical protein